MLLSSARTYQLVGCEQPFDPRLCLPGLLSVPSPASPPTTSRPTDVGTDSAGIRAGAVATLPGLWLALEGILLAGPETVPLWFRIVGRGTVIFLFVLASLAGFLGGTVGRRLALEAGQRSGLAVGN